MPQVYNFREIGRLPDEGDNVAIATRRLEAGTWIACRNGRFQVDTTILEGHRFATDHISRGKELLSWGLPFGVATREILPGSWARNQQILDALKMRRIDFELPTAANFEDRIDRFELDPNRFQPGSQVPPIQDGLNFLGFRRSHDRGIGTRNYIILLGTSSRTASFVRSLARELEDRVAAFPNIDGIVPVAHTEGGDTDVPNNLDHHLRTLCGFMVHPNVGAVLAVDAGAEALNNARLQDYLEKFNYPIASLLHDFSSIGADYHLAREHARHQIEAWLPIVNECKRTAEPVAELKVAIQCGGSDAFSGISGNPLVSEVVREVIQRGGSANLAETDELIGAESYVLANVRNWETAHRFLDFVERFKEIASWHGVTAESNPSAGNKFRGLYNIVIKSLGAAIKKHPQVCLDYAIDYGERMKQSGFYFMNSPGNDLESIAGQVASGCNLVFFITGNGSITNFPFVPTIKVVTTTGRFQLLNGDMDVNAGAYLDGRKMSDLCQETFALAREIASGNRSRGERAGHSQVSLWRAWPQSGPDALDALLDRGEPETRQVGLKPFPALPATPFPAWPNTRGLSLERLGLIMPSSLCSSQIARMAAERMTSGEVGKEKGISRFVALPHTEGCGFGGRTVIPILTRTMIGYMTHPFVECGLFLEHGCEKTPNDLLFHEVVKRGLDPDDFGWASVQLDGGIDRVLDKIEQWFQERILSLPNPEVVQADFASIKVGLSGTPEMDRAACQQAVSIVKLVTGAGGSVIVPQNSPLLESPLFCKSLFAEDHPRASLAYSAPPSEPGCYIMETPSNHWIETLSGLGATGIQGVLMGGGETPLQNHPFIPVISLANALPPWSDEPLSATTAQIFCEALIKALKGRTSAWQQDEERADFQLSRGPLGLSA